MSETNTNLRDWGQFDAPKLLCLRSFTTAQLSLRVASKSPHGALIVNHNSKVPTSLHKAEGTFGKFGYFDARGHREVAGGRLPKSK